MNIDTFLARLSADQLDEVIAKAKALKQFAGTASQLTKAEPDSDTEFMFDAIVRHCRRYNLDSRTTIALRKATRINTFAAKVPDVMLFLRKGSKKRQGQLLLLNLAFHAMIERLPADIAPGAMFLINNTHRVPSILESLLPGYASNDLLKPIVELVMRRGMARPKAKAVDRPNTPAKIRHQQPKSSSRR